MHARSSSAEGSTADVHDKDGMVHGWRTETDLATWSSFDAFPAATRESSASGMLKYHAPTTRSSADSIGRVPVGSDSTVQQQQQRVPPFVPPPARDGGLALLPLHPSRDFLRQPQGGRARK